MTTLKRPLLALAVLFGILGGPLGAAEKPARPNVLFISIDDLRDWVGYLGRHPQVKTPHLDRLAKMGVAFTRSYCAAPLCNPSRAALMSGLRPGSTGVYGNETDWRPAIGEDKMLTTAFRTAGYFVCGAGKIYHEAFTRRSEWDDYLGKEGGGPEPKRSPQAKGKGVGGIGFFPLACEDDALPDYRIADYGIAQLQRPHERPFFLAVGLHKPHMAWAVPQKYFDMFPLESIQLPPYREDDLADIPPAGVALAKPDGDHKTMLESGRWKEAVQAYLAAIAYTDMNVGRLLEALEKSAYRDNTIICLWSDHGWHLGEKRHWRKFTLWEEGTRSPLLWVAPGVTKPGGVCERSVDLMSVYPTLTDLCGIPTPKHVEGESIRALLADPRAEWKTPAITTFPRGSHAIRSEGWRYIRYSDGSEELYDEKADPNEWNNLASGPAAAAIKADLAKFLPTKDAARAGGNKKKRQPKQ